MPNLNIVRLKPLTEATHRVAAAQERIATVLEAIARAHLGIEVVPQKSPDEESTTPIVSYATDEETTARLIEEELQRVGIKPGDFSE